MNPNWTAFFATRLETLFSTIPARVYSNIDPARAYAGEPIVEVQEGAPNFRDYITGKSEIVREFTVSCRAPNASLALEMGRSARGMLFNVLKLWEEDLALYGVVFDEIAVEPDERGIVVGESFYCYVKFKFTENCGLPQGA